MKMMILVAVMTLTGVLAQAAGRGDAAEICKSMSFQTDKDACMADLRKYDFFDQRAIDICQTMSFGTDKLACLNAIGNKAYETYEIELCGQKVFGTDKTTCLQNAGEFQAPPPVQSCLSAQQMIYELQKVDRMVYDRDTNRARTAISDLIYSLQRCP